MGGHLRDAVRALAHPGADWLDAEPWVAMEAVRLATDFRDDRWTWRR
jgi:hypothetical protein